VSGFNSRCETFISVFNQPSRSTQPGHPFVGRRNEYESEGGDAWQLGSKGNGSCMGLEVKPCDPLITHGPYLSPLEIKGLYIKSYINSPVYFTLLYKLVCLAEDYGNESQRSPRPV